MSALCQKRTFSASFDHLVSALLEFRRHVEAERLGRLETHHGYIAGGQLIALSARLSERAVASGRQYFEFKPTRSTLPSNFWLAFVKSCSAAVKALAAATE